MKKILILTVFAVIAFTVIPAKTNACIKALGFLDPLCVATGKVSLPGLGTSNSSTVNNVTNSNNVNSNINSPSAVVTTGTPTYVTPTPTPAPVIVYTPTYPVYYPTYPTYPSNPSYSQLGVSCYSTPTSGNVGASVSWGASAYGGTGNYYITWSGSDGLSGYGTSVYMTYNTPGSKYASVTVTSGSQTVTQNCSNVTIYDYNYNGYYNNSYYNNYNNNYNYNYSQLYVSCTANTTFTPVETNVTWTANVSGGNGYYTYNWSGTDYLSGTGKSIGAIYHSSGTKTASVTVYSGNQTITQVCSNSVLVGTPNYYGNNYNNNYVAPAPIVKYVSVEKKPVVKTEVKTTETKTTEDNSLSAASLFSLKNVPWGWVAVLVILMLMAMVIYLIFNRNKI